jgi:hypothetical protein
MYCTKSIRYQDFYLETNRYVAYTLDIRIIHDPGRSEKDITRFYHITQNGNNLKHELFTSEIFYLLFLDHYGLQVTATVKMKPQIRGVLYRGRTGAFYFRAKKSFPETSYGNEQD